MSCRCCCNAVLHNVEGVVVVVVVLAVVRVVVLVLPSQVAVVVVIVVVILLWVRIPLLSPDGNFSQIGILKKYSYFIFKSKFRQINSNFIFEVLAESPASSLLLSQRASEQRSGRRGSPITFKHIFVQ